jgi:hypothetical protein
MGRIYTIMVLPLLKRLALSRVARKERKLEHLSRRMGGLQLGVSMHLWENLPGLEEMATGGLGLKRSLAAVRQVLESDSNVNWNRTAELMDMIDPFLRDAHLLLDHYDQGREGDNRLFIVRKNIKGLF